MEKVSMEHLEQMLDDGETLVLNVLDAESFADGHIPGTVNIPLDDKDFIGRVERRAGDRDTPIVVYCSGPSCPASPRAGRDLEDAGFTEVYHYPGGLEEWGAEHEVTAAT